MRDKIMKSFFSRMLMIVISSFIINSSLSAQKEQNTNNYEKTAKDLTAQLNRQVKLDKDQMTEIQDILVNYQQDIADRWESRGNEGGANLVEDLRDADKSANDKIEKILNGKEISGYMDYKKEWWSGIKKHVYSKDFMDMAYYREDDENSRLTADERETGDNRTVRNESTVKTLDAKDLESRITPFAKEQSERLMNKLNLSLQQAADVQEALVEYQKDIAQTRDKMMNNDRDYTPDVAVNDRTARDNRRNDNDTRDNVTGRNNENVRESVFQETDNSAIDKIENVFNDNQKSRFERVRTQWWTNVKEKVYANVQRENGRTENGNKK